MPCTPLQSPFISGGGAQLFFFFFLRLRVSADSPPLSLLERGAPICVLLCLLVTCDLAARGVQADETGEVMMLLIRDTNPC